MKQKIYLTYKAQIKDNGDFDNSDYLEVQQIKIMNKNHWIVVTAKPISKAQYYRELDCKNTAWEIEIDIDKNNINKSQKLDNKDETKKVDAFGNNAKLIADGINNYLDINKDAKFMMNQKDKEIKREYKHQELCEVCGKPKLTSYFTSYDMEICEKCFNSKIETILTMAKNKNQANKLLGEKNNGNM